MKHCILALIAVAALASGPARADSFMPPSVTETRSPQGTAMVTVIPAMLSCAVGEEDCEPAARAVVERLQGPFKAGSRTVALVNAQAPSLALVTDDAERLLTVNDYASAGFGENVLVVYDDHGAIIARHALGDFLPDDYINGLPRTASTLRWWAAPPVIEPGTHIATISLHLVGPEPWGGAGKALALRLDLDTGHIERPSGPAWEAALNCARAHAWLVPDDAAVRQREHFRKLCR